MAKLLLLGLIVLSIITLGTFGAMAAGYGPDFMVGDHMGRGGGCDRFDDDNQDSSRGRCFSSGDEVCNGPNSEECEKYCEENGYTPEDCPMKNDDCPNAGPCY